MRLAWYAGTSAALATGVVAYAFNQRANFYSAMVYLSQNNLSLMLLVNLVLLVYGSLVWGLQRLCYGPLRPIEVEQLYEKAWFAVTETCLAMTIFREEVGAWFLVMFTSLVTGKVWEWIGEGRVEVLEQQPPANPRLFHTRLSISLLLSIAYDVSLFIYAVRSVIQQARPNMMVMFLFEFAILSACSFRTGARYILTLIEADLVKRQTRQRLEERRHQVRQDRLDIMRRRESDDPTEAEAALNEDLPDENDIEEMDIEVPGWEAKGQAVLGLDLFTDFIKLGIYSAFFAILMTFYGLPIHILRDLFMTARSFVKRLGALMRYRKALQDMNRYPDATEEQLSREDTCIICREEMRPWDPSAGAVERSRPKKLPCGHILHFGCLKSWLERQQVCPTCRRSVVIDGPAPGDAAAPRANGPAPVPGQQPQDNAAGGAGRQGAAGRPNMRVFQLGPIRLGFAQGNPANIDMQDMAQRLRQPAEARGNDAAPAAVPARTALNGTISPMAPLGPLGTSGSVSEIRAQLDQAADRIQQEMRGLGQANLELAHLYAMTAELERIRSIHRLQSGASAHPGQASTAQYPQPLLQPTMAFPPMPVLQPGGPSFGQIPPFRPDMAQLPPRTGTPTVHRHGGASYSAAIPAGSSDLPEGVVLPEGWSLLPLQRLDNQGAPVAQGAPTTSQGGGAPPGAPTAAPANNPGTGSAHDSGINNFNTTRNPEAGQEGSHRNEATGASSDDASGARSDEPVVAAPKPVVPNWGGAAQLFANAGASSATPPPSEPSSQVPEDDVGEGPSSQRRGGGETCNSEDKGKAKAVTVEDADEDEGGFA